MIEFDPAMLDATQQYKLLSATVVPRPIGLVTTLGPEGPNAAPFSFFNMVAVDPPMVMISCAPRAPGVEKEGRDTYVRLTDRFQMARPVVGTEQA